MLNFRSENSVFKFSVTENDMKLLSSSGLRMAFLLLTFVVNFNFISHPGMAQEKKQMVRLAKIKIDPNQTEAYYAALKEQMNTATKTEPGVLTYYAVADQHDPSVITILEIYADEAAYKSHITTAHFKKYKETVKDMVKSLELIDVNLIAAAHHSTN